MGAYIARSTVTKFIFTAVMLLMASCDSFKTQELDEFTIISNPPLASPPIFAPSAQDKESKSEDMEQIDKTFLRKFGSYDTQNIRKIVDQEYIKTHAKQKHFITKIMSKITRNDVKNTVDPFEERERLKKSQHTK